MENLERLGKKIKTAHDLLAVVKTMKSLAAVNIRQFEAAARSMDAYTHVIETGWQALFRNHVHVQRRKRSSVAVCLVIGSDQGMCGQFNDIIVQFALEETASLQAQGIVPYCWTAGERVRAGMEEEYSIEEHFSLPSSHDAISDLMFTIVQHFAGLHEQEQIEMFFLYYNRLGRGGMYEPVFLQVLPFDARWSKQHKEAPWASRSLPVIGMEMDVFFEHLFRQHIFASIFKAFAQSLASENAARLAAMQAAEKNILELEEKLQRNFRDTRQSAITAELLDIVSGFEALGLA